MGCVAEWAVLLGEQCCWVSSVVGCSAVLLSGLCCWVSSVVERVVVLLQTQDGRAAAEVHQCDEGLADPLVHAGPRLRHAGVL